MLARRPRPSVSPGRSALASARTACAGLALALAPSAAAGVPATLYEWMATAPVVLVGSVAVDDQRYVEFEATSVLRGAITPGSRVSVDVRSANRDRVAGVDRLDPELGRSYLVLLEPGEVKRSGRPAAFRLIHGVAGAREVPLEGAEAFLRAIGRMIAVQDTRDDARVWQEFRSLLEESDPLLIETALAMYEKFRRADRPHLPLLRPLLDHPRGEIRAYAARLIGEVARARGPLPQEESDAVLGELAARARRDGEPLVRIAATGAVAAFPGAKAEVVLREIAKEDPEQGVRFEAQKSLYERSGGEASRARPR